MDAIQHAESALHHLQLRRQILQDRLTDLPKDTSSTTAQTSPFLTEMEDLDSLFPEIIAKVT
ncbi:hypothetical protein, partial [Vibrio cholerae]|uniref:hypothetical protein n=1 Tax=Vibrio cholerae TaxID=666 RepID=UPI0018F0A43B